MTAWVVIAFFTGFAIGALAATILGQHEDDEWKTAYLNCRDRLYRLEREQEHA